MHRIISNEIFAAKNIPRIRQLVLLDLTAGDGVPIDDIVPGTELDWTRNCSPGIKASLAKLSVKPVTIGLFEDKPKTFERLMGSLNEQLPKLGYVGEDDEWRYGDLVKLKAYNNSGADVPVHWVKPWIAVLAVNDPNAITTWAMRPSFPQEVAERTPWFRSMSTMGCNASGQKRMDLSERLQWFEHVAGQESALPRHHDLLLAAIEKDKSQWAYLINESEKWCKRTSAAVDSCFGKYGRTVAKALFRTEPERFEEIKRELFLTKKEREGSRV